MASKSPTISQWMPSSTVRLPIYGRGSTAYAHDCMAKYLTPHPLYTGLGDGGGRFEGGSIATNYITDI